MSFSLVALLRCIIKFSFMNKINISTLYFIKNNTDSAYIHNMETLLKYRNEYFTDMFLICKRVQNIIHTLCIHGLWLIHF